MAVEATKTSMLSANMNTQMEIKELLKKEPEKLATSFKGLKNSVI